MQSRVKKLLEKHKRTNKRKSNESMDFETVPDFKHFTSFTFLCKEDKLVYQEQLISRCGSTTNKLVDFIPHPSQIRHLDQNSSFTLNPLPSENLSASESDGNDFEADYAPARNYSEAKSVGKVVNSTQISFRKANLFLTHIKKLTSH